MSEQIRMSTIFPARVGRLYRAWLSSTEHGAFTGTGTQIDPVVGGKFSTGDGYISGTTLLLEEPRRIVQAWRTTDFPADAPDSRLELIFETNGDGMRLTLIQTDIPDGQGEDYKQGWEDYYFAPMREYFARE